MLTQKMRLFAEAFVAGKNQTESAIAAGYSKNAAKQQGYKLSKNKDVIAHIERIKQNMEESKPVLEKKTEKLNKGNHKYNDPLDFIKDVMNNENEDPKLRLDAAKAIMPYIHPKLGEQGKKSALEDKAKIASSSIFQAQSPPKNKHTIN